MAIYSEWYGSKSGTWQGGDDTIAATETSFESVGPSFYGGDDTLTGADNAYFQQIHGDALWMQDQAVGGDDRLQAGSDVYLHQGLWGDAEQMTGSARGGDDVLVGMATERTSDSVREGTWLVGDAGMMWDSTVCGNDTLISGAGTDWMHGDAQSRTAGVTTGRDRFVFGPGNGNDVIGDFEPGKDLIDLSALDLGLLALWASRPQIPVDRLPAKALAALTTHAVSGFSLLDGNHNRVLDDGDAWVSVTDDGGTVLDLGAAVGSAAGKNTVMLVGVTGLQASDFVF